MRPMHVQEYKYGGVKHYSYPVRLISAAADVIIVYGAIGRPLNHPGRGLVNLPLNNESVEFHFTQRPYNVIAGWNPDGSFRHYYCNVATPATLEGKTVSCTDLDLDLVVRPDLTYHVEDEDEFEQHRADWGYPHEIVALAREGLAELIRLVESRAFPFDGTAQRLRDAARQQAR